MTHEKFSRLRSQDKIRAGIDNSAALRLVGHLPKRYRMAHYFWSWIWVLSIPAFICVAVFYKWWVGILLLLFGTPAIFSATKKSAAQFVLQHADEDPDFFNLLVRNDLLTFRQIE